MDNEQLATIDDETLDEVSGGGGLLGFVIGAGVLYTGMTFATAAIVGAGAAMSAAGGVIVRAFSGNA